MTLHTSFDHCGNIIIREKDFQFICAHSELLKIWRYIHFKADSGNDRPVLTYFKSLSPEKQSNIAIKSYTE